VRPSKVGHTPCYCVLFTKMMNSNRTLSSINLKTNLYSITTSQYNTAFNAVFNKQISKVKSLPVPS